MMAGPSGATPPTRIVRTEARWSAVMAGWLATNPTSGRSQGLGAAKATRHTPYSPGMQHAVIELPSNNNMSLIRSTKNLNFS